MGDFLLDLATHALAAFVKWASEEGQQEQLDEMERRYLRIVAMRDDTAALDAELDRLLAGRNLPPPEGDQ